MRFGTATKEAVPTGTPAHPTNTDLTNFPDGLGTYSKALKQSNMPGIVDPSTFDHFLKACGAKPSANQLGKFDESGIMVGGQARLNGPRGAFALQLVGKDSAGYAVPAPPALGSMAYAIELVELYWASLLRDVPFSEYSSNATAQAAANELTALATANSGQYAGPLDASGKVTPDLLFRGGQNANPAWFDGVTVGPYLSQFCLTPTSMGRVPVDQKIRTLMPGEDFMTDLATWYDIQNGAAPTAALNYDPVHRYMRTGRDTAAYTQVDELYQAYFIAYLVAATLGIPANPGNPYFHPKYKDHEKAFGTFGGPDIAATLAAVAKAALSAVWYQKWRVHLRHRPESGGAIVELLQTSKLNPTDAGNLANFDIVRNSGALNLSRLRNGSNLLSQAFPEGAPTHPAYPTGHGTVAGACITVLKFFLDGEWTFPHPVVPSTDGLTLDGYPGASSLSVNGELHKLVYNVSFGHGVHAGIHWRSDTDFSILLGEAFAIDYLEDQIYSYQEDFDIKIKKIDGTPYRFINH